MGSTPTSFNMSKEQIRIIGFYLRNHQHFIVWHHDKDGAWYQISRIEKVNGHWFAYLFNVSKPNNAVEVDVADIMVTSTTISAIEAVP